ncbi:MAG: hypothetical protein HZA34_03675 [Candidatus Pacebacteria bacterium]|nr:hypothetical protein [Candidatus Paceibacterota bacterium]
MKFKKILVIGIDKAQLDAWSWDDIDSLTEKRICLPADSSEIDSELKDADCLLVYFNKADKKMIDKASTLKYIGALATGVGKIDISYATKKGIIVTNVPGYSTESVAEFVLAILLENLREISRAKGESKKGNRSELGFSSREIKGKKFGIIGLGSIGLRTAQLAQAFGAHVFYWSRRRKKDVEKKGIVFSQLKDLLKTSDILSFHLSLNPETKNIMDKENIEQIKTGSIVINTAPMELFNGASLEKRIRGGDITFIFDHTDIGDISEENLKRFQKYKNCITYPAIGYISNEARIAKQKIFILNMKKFLHGTPINRVVA